MPECKTVSVQLWGGVALQCPSCSYVVVRDNEGGISCVNPDCDMHQRVFEAPMVELVPRKEPEKEAPGPLEMPTGDEPPWPHPDSYEVKLMQHIWPEPHLQPDYVRHINDAAELRWIRERLREIEWYPPPTDGWRDDYDYLICAACNRYHYRRYPYEPEHNLDCWLKAEIDKLEDD